MSWGGAGDRRSWVRAGVLAGKIGNEMETAAAMNSKLELTRRASGNHVTHTWSLVSCFMHNTSRTAAVECIICGNWQSSCRNGFGSENRNLFAQIVSCADFRTGFVACCATVLYILVQFGTIPKYKQQKITLTHQSGAKKIGYVTRIIARLCVCPARTGFGLSETAALTYFAPPTTPMPGRTYCSLTAGGACAALR